VPTTASSKSDGFLNGGIIDPAELAAALERLYANPALRESRADTAYERIMSPAYRWENIAGQWWDVITGIANSNRRC
jgi:glycosyltransferase involved in cell wall biosynthesis